MMINGVSCIQFCSLHDTNIPYTVSPGLLLDICHAVDVRAVLPKFMLQNFKAYGRRQNIRMANTLPPDNSSTPTRFTSVVETIYTTWTNQRAISTFTTTYFSGSTPIVELNVPDDSALLVSSLLSAASASASDSFSRLTASLEPFRTSGGASGTGSSVQQATTSGGAVDSGSSGKESSSGGTSGRRKGGFGTAAKIGIAVGLIVILFLVGGLILWYRKRKGKATQTENVIGGGANPTSTIPGMAEVDGQSSQQPPAYDKYYGKETVTTPPPVVAKPESAHLSAVSPTSPGAHELSSQHSHSGVASVTGGVASHHNDPNRQELSAIESLPTKAELPSTPAQTYAPVIGRKPISPRPISESTSPPTWDYVYSPGNDVSSVSEQGTTTIGSGLTGVSRGDHETRAMEEEMARIRAQKERLHQLNVLEQREEELRRQMEARKSGNASL